LSKSDYGRRGIFYVSEGLLLSVRIRLPTAALRRNLLLFFVLTQGFFIPEKN